MSTFAKVKAVCQELVDVTGVKPMRAKEASIAQELGDD